MSDNLPGFSEEDQAPPLSPSELARQERMDTALNTWRETGSIAKVKRALGLTGAGDRVARVWINRAIEELKEGREDEREHVFRFMADNYMEVLGALFTEFREGDRSKINEMKTIGDRVAKLWGVDAVREMEGEGPQILVIETRRPDEREPVIDGVEVKDPGVLDP